MEDTGNRTVPISESDYRKQQQPSQTRMCQTESLEHLQLNHTVKKSTIHQMILRMPRQLHPSVERQHEPGLKHGAGNVTASNGAQITRIPPAHLTKTSTSALMSIPKVTGL